MVPMDGMLEHARSTKAFRGAVPRFGDDRHWHWEPRINLVQKNGAPSNGRRIEFRKQHNPPGRGAILTRLQFGHS